MPAVLGCAVLGWAVLGEARLGYAGLGCAALRCAVNATTCQLELCLPASLAVFTRACGLTAGAEQMYTLHLPAAQRVIFTDINEAVQRFKANSLDVYAQPSNHNPSFDAVSSGNLWYQASDMSQLSEVVLFGIVLYDGCDKVIFVET